MTRSSCCCAATQAPGAVGFPVLFFFFLFNDTATTEIYPLSLHDALPILLRVQSRHQMTELHEDGHATGPVVDRKSTRLNSSHGSISYAVFCLNTKQQPHSPPRHTCAHARRATTYPTTRH